MERRYTYDEGSLMVLDEVNNVRQVIDHKQLALRVKSRRALL